MTKPLQDIIDRMRQNLFMHSHEKYVGSESDLQINSIRSIKICEDAITQAYNQGVLSSDHFYRTQKDKWDKLAFEKGAQSVLEKMKEKTRREINAHKAILEEYEGGQFPKSWHEGNINALVSVQLDLLSSNPIEK